MAVDTPTPSPGPAGGQPQKPPRTKASGSDYRLANWVCGLGAVVLLFVGFQLWGTGVQERHFQATLKRQFDILVHRAGSQAAAIRQGTVVAHLQIPAIHLDQYVVQGTDRRRLEEGPGHYVGAPLPGQHGNAAISGHRTSYGSPFDHLDQLSVGDVILATTASGTYRYVVSSQPTVVPPSRHDVLDDQGDDRLTLTTCTPRYTATDRLIVTARLDRQVSPALPSSSRDQASATTPRPGGNSDRTGWQWRQAPAAIVISALLAALAFGFQRLRLLLGRFGTWLILTPVWLVGLLLLFERVGQFLPANL